MSPTLLFFTILLSILGPLQFNIKLKLSCQFLPEMADVILTRIMWSFEITTILIISKF